MIFFILLLFNSKISKFYLYKIIGLFCSVYFNKIFFLLTFKIEFFNSNYSKKKGFHYQ